MTSECTRKRKTGKARLAAMVAVAGLLLLPAVAGATTILELRTEADVCYFEDDQMVVEVYVSNQPQPVNSMQFSVEYDDTVLEYVSAQIQVAGTWFGLLGGSSFFEQADDGTVGYIDAAFSTFTDPIPLPPPDETLVARFTFDVDTGAQWCNGGLVWFRDLPVLGTKVGFVVVDAGDLFFEVPVQLDLGSVGVDALGLGSIVFTGLADDLFECESDVPPIPTDIPVTGCGEVTCTVTDVIVGVSECPFDIERTFDCTDACGNNGVHVQTFTIDDATDPTIGCPMDLSVVCVEDVPPCATTIAEFDAMGGTVSDNCAEELTLTCSDVGGPCGAITRTYTVTDSCDNFATCDQIITVTDNVPPLIQCPDNATVECDEPRDPTFWAHKMHYPQLPDPMGWDVNTTIGSGSPVADDWLCTASGPVSDIHFWGSWKGDEVGDISLFFVTIHEDIPAGTDGIPFSRPGLIVWGSRIFAAGQFTVTEVDPGGNQGWFDPLTSEVIPDDHTRFFRYDIENITDPFMQVEDTIYWLQITAVVADVDPPDPQPVWGWKTTDSHWNDDAVYLDGTEWMELREPSFVPTDPTTDDFFVEFNAGIPVFFGGSGFMGGQWYEYDSGWWNVWFYDGLFVPENQKVVHIELPVPFDPVPPFEVALNWSTPEWSLQDPPPTGPPIPPLTPGEEDLFIQRASLGTIQTAGMYVFDYIIWDYNPEWVSIDIRGADGMPLNLAWIGTPPSPPGIIVHSCQLFESMDMAFVITDGSDETPVLGYAYAEDNCAGVTVAYDDDESGLTGCNGTGTVARTWTATDTCGNVSVCTQTITVVDTTPPVLTVPPDVTVECDDVIDPGIILSTDEGLLGSGYARLDIPGGLALNAITSLSYTAKVTTPGAGGFAPEVVLNIDADGDGTLEGTGAAWMHSFYDPTTLGYVDGTDRGDNFLSGDNWPPAAGSPDGTYVNRDAIGAGYSYWSADDERDGFGSFWAPFATVLGTHLPVHDIDATDLVYSIDVVVGTSPNFDGMTAVIQSIELNGTTYPVGSLSYGTVGTGGGATATLFAGATATDNCDPAPVVTYADVETPGDCDEEMTITRTWTATDACGNFSTDVQTITVVDTTAPEISCPADDDTLKCAGDVPAPDTGLVTASDNCDADPVVTHVSDVPDAGAGCVGDPLTITRTYRATDDCGNSTDCTQTFTIADDVDPAITCPDDLTIECEDDVPLPASDYTEFVALTGAAASDNCGSDPTISWEGDVDNGGSGCPGDPLIITRTYRATDDCGNFVECTQTITVVDTTGPDMTCPLDAFVQCDDNVPAAATDFDEFVLAGGVVADNCGGAVTVTHISDVSDGMSCPETITRTYEAEDDCGNTSTCVQLIVVNDTLPPASVFCPDDIVVPPINGPDCDEAVATWADPTWLDNCDDTLTVVSNYDSGDTFPTGDTIVTYTATDDCGNVGTCEFTVTVLDGAYLDVVVELEDSEAFSGSPPFTRCVEFELWECPAYVVIFDATMTFTEASPGSPYTATATIGPVTCGDFECVTARDPLHTLRSATTDLAVDPDTGFWVASFTDEDALVSGNLSGYLFSPPDCVDIVDFSMLASQYDPLCTSPIGKNSTCSTVGPHSDINGDGCVTLFDFSILQSNFAECDEACCVALRGGDEYEVLHEVSVKQLDEMGLGYLSVIDVDADGWVTMDDVLAYMAQVEQEQQEPEWSTSPDPQEPSTTPEANPPKERDDTSAGRRR